MTMSALYLAASIAARDTLAQIDAAGLVPGRRPVPRADLERVVGTDPLRLPPRVLPAEPAPPPEAARDASAAPRAVLPTAVCGNTAGGHAA